MIGEEWRGSVSEKTGNDQQHWMCWGLKYGAALLGLESEGFVVQKVLISERAHRLGFSSKQEKALKESPTRRRDDLGFLTSCRAGAPLLCAGLGWRRIGNEVVTPCLRPASLKADFGGFLCQHQHVRRS